MLIFPDYFITGELPREPYMNTTRLIISEAKLVADCLMVAGLATICPVEELPKDYQKVLNEAADALGMTTTEPFLPPTAEGFSQYAKRSGLLSGD